MPAYPGRIRNVTAYDRALSENQPLVVHRRFTAAELTTAGTDLLAPPAPGLKYRLIDCVFIAVGATVGGATDIRILGTQAAVSVALTTVPVAGLTQSTMVRLGSAAAPVLANGASQQPCDQATGIKIARTGSAVSGATHLDVIASFLLES